MIVNQRILSMVAGVLAPEMMADEDDRQRFVRSMKTMIPLNDPHLVEIYNAGIHRSMAIDRSECGPLLPGDFQLLSAA